MSPEQVGASPVHGDWRSDQFVLGLLAYTLLTGVRAYTGRNPIELWQAPALQTPRPVQAVRPEVPGVVADIVERMLERRPHRRYLRADTLSEDVVRAVAALALEGGRASSSRASS